VFVSGMFNVLHPGHFRFLNFAANLGQKLVVGVLSDEQAPEATVPAQERLQNISALSFVDEAVLLNETPEKKVEELRPDIVVKGWEHHDRENAEKPILDGYGGKLVFSSGDILLSGVKNDENEDIAYRAIKTISMPYDFMNRHGITLQSARDILQKFSSLRVCVLGDIIIDNYVTCQAVGMSREDPTIVVRPVESQFFLGAAGIVAAHASGLGAKVHFLSVCGEDEAGRFSQRKLKEYNVSYDVFIDESRPTTQKKRYRAHNKTMLRVNDYSDHPISNEVKEKIFSRFKELAPEIDVVIFSDFSYGALPQDLVDDVTKYAREKNIIIAADSQCSSQTGDISRFKNVSLITPTEFEVRTSLNNFADGLIRLAERLREKTSVGNLVVTLGEEGILVSGLDDDLSVVNDRLPALQSVPVDPAGAGDAFLVASSMCLAAGATIWEASFVGSVAAAVQVSRIGNLPLQDNELRRAFSK